MFKEFPLFWASLLNRQRKFLRNNNISFKIVKKCCEMLSKSGDIYRILVVLLWILGHSKKKDVSSINTHYLANNHKLSPICLLFKEITLFCSIWCYGCTEILKNSLSLLQNCNKLSSSWKIICLDAKTLDKPCVVDMDTYGLKFSEVVHKVFS